MPIFRNLLYRLAQAATEPLVWRVERFRRSCEHPEQVQTALLQRILSRQRRTAFGQDHSFSSITSVAEYRKQVPVAPYERLAPYIERMKRGEVNALIADDPLLLFALTSGTTASRKFIPITRQYLKDYRRGWSMWGIRAYRDHQDRRLGLRPIVQLSGDPEEFVTEGGTPCGNLSGFTAIAQKRMVRRLYCVPPQVGKLKDPLTRYYVALRFSIGLPVALFLSANPSTMLMFARVLDQEKDHLLQDLHDGTLRADLALTAVQHATLSARLRPQPERARALRQRAERVGRLYPRDIWPAETALMGTWTGGSMQPYLRQIPEYFGDIPIRDLGLLASEGRMSIPFANHTASGVLDIASHYFEFIPEAEVESAQPVVLGAHELHEGGSYFIVPTTATGLYRYQISDLIRVTGFLGRTPMIEFLGKGNRFSNLTGEKLSEHQVTQAQERTTQQTGLALRAYSLAPVWDDRLPFYGLYVEEDAGLTDRQLAAYLQSLDRELQLLNSEYEAKRESQRLGPLRAFLLPQGTWADWDARRLADTGGSPEQYKHPCLIGDLKFHQQMPVVRAVPA
jgi:hypothetical protein